jgi:hypothetical protein
MKNIHFEMSRKDALKQGLLTCGNCGYPENNHFDFSALGMEKRPCAHDKTCKNYREVARVGQIVKSKNG